MFNTAYAPTQQLFSSTNGHPQFVGEEIVLIRQRNLPVVYDRNKIIPPENLGLMRPSTLPFLEILETPAGRWMCPGYLARWRKTQGPFTSIALTNGQQPAREIKEVISDLAVPSYPRAMLDVQLSQSNQGSLLQVRAPAHPQIHGNNGGMLFFESEVSICMFHSEN